MIGNLNDWVGGILLGVGLAFVILGWLAAWSEYRKPRPDLDARLEGSEISVLDLAKMIEAATKLLEALTKAQLWLATTFIGITFVGIGLWVLSTNALA